MKTMNAISVIVLMILDEAALCKFIEKHGKTVLEQSYLAENIRKIAVRLHLPKTLIDKAYNVDQYFYMAEEYSHYDKFEYDEAEEEEAFYRSISEDCEVLLTEEPVESLEEKRERMLRKYDVLYGEDLSEYDFEGPSFGKERATELAEKFCAAHRGNDYEDNYARGLAHKLLNFLEWTPRTEFTYGEVLARLDY